MKRKLVVLCLKLALAFEVMAEIIAYPEVEGKEYKVSWFGFKGDYNW